MGIECKPKTTKNMDLNVTYISSARMVTLKMISLDFFGPTLLIFRAGTGFITAIRSADLDLSQILTHQGWRVV